MIFYPDNWHTVECLSCNQDYIVQKLQRNCILFFVQSCVVTTVIVYHIFLDKVKSCWQLPSAEIVSWRVDEHLPMIWHWKKISKLTIGKLDFLHKIKLWTYWHYYVIVTAHACLWFLSINVLCYTVTLLQMVMVECHRSIMYSVGKIPWATSTFHAAEEAINLAFSLIWSRQSYEEALEPFLT